MGHLPYRLKYERRQKRMRPIKATNIPGARAYTTGPGKPTTGVSARDMDTIVDPYGHSILTLTERSTNFVLMEKLREVKKSKSLAKVIWRLLLPYKGKALKSITTDNGSEFAEHEWITERLDVPVSFADSYCAWQKGAIENGNKLVRQYISKGTDIGSVTDGKIARIRKKINARPREKLNFLTSVERFFKNIS